MGEGAKPDEEAPTFVITDFADAYPALRAYGENGAVIVDVREADEPTRRRVADLCTGAGIAFGYSPFKLAVDVHFLTTGRFPTSVERQKYSR